jgi:hypothetical protein
MQHRLALEHGFVPTVSAAEGVKHPLVYADVVTLSHVDDRTIEEVDQLWLQP